MSYAPENRAFYGSRDWTCTGCRHVNFRRRERCEDCGRAKPAAPAPAAPEAGDWTCAACGASNFKRRTHCFKCGQAGAGAPAASSSSSSDDKSCLICLEAPRTHVVLPCMHAHFCGACAAGLAPGTACPSCRTPIAEVKRFFN